MDYYVHASKKYLFSFTTIIIALYQTLHLIICYIKDLHKIEDHPSQIQCVLNSQIFLQASNVENAVLSTACVSNTTSFGFIQQ